MKSTDVKNPRTLTSVLAINRCKKPQDVTITSVIDMHRCKKDERDVTLTSVYSFHRYKNYYIYLRNKPSLLFISLLFSRYNPCCYSLSVSVLRSAYTVCPSPPTNVVRPSPSPCRSASSCTKTSVTSFRLPPCMKTSSILQPSQPAAVFETPVAVQLRFR